MTFTSRFANPGQFLRLASLVMPWLAGLSVAFFGVGLYYALFHSPPDYQQGETVRIMYVHVPAAWMGMMIYGAMALAAAVGLVWRHALADIFCVAAAPVGAVLVALCLMTGSIWGKPTWGTWWAWDARLTSVLIMFLLYCGIIILRQSFDDHERGFKASAILILVGAVNIPIVRFSVDWWHTLHQPASILRLSGGPTVDPQMLMPLFLMGLAYSFFGAFLILMRMRTELIARRIETAMILGNLPTWVEVKRRETAYLIRTFVAGTSGKWDWDDFITIRQKDPKLEDIRKRANATHDEYPSDKANEWCNEEGVQELLKMAEELES